MLDIHFKFKTNTENLLNAVYAIIYNPNISQKNEKTLEKTAKAKQNAKKLWERTQAIQKICSNRSIYLELLFVPCLVSLIVLIPMNFSFFVQTIFLILLYTNSICRATSVESFSEFEFLLTFYSSSRIIRIITSICIFHIISKLFYVNSRAFSVLFSCINFSVFVCRERDMANYMEQWCQLDWILLEDSSLKMFVI